jgi:Protein of unknown function (DUF2721)
MIAAMITPAMLILASGSLIATALVRLARVVDRLRKLAEPKRASEMAWPSGAGDTQWTEWFNWQMMYVLLKTLPFSLLNWRATLGEHRRRKA